MINHSLISLVLISFSIVTSAAATPTDVNQAVQGAIPNAVLRKDVMLEQGGNSDKDVANLLWYFFGLIIPHRSVFIPLCKRTHELVITLRCYQRNSFHVA